MLLDERAMVTLQKPGLTYYGARVYQTPDQLYKKVKTKIGITLITRKIQVYYQLKSKQNPTNNNELKMQQPIKNNMKKISFKD